VKKSLREQETGNREPGTGSELLLSGLTATLEAGLLRDVRRLHCETTKQR